MGVSGRPLPRGRRHPRCDDLAECPAPPSDPVVLLLAGEHGLAAVQDVESGRNTLSGMYRFLSISKINVCEFVIAVGRAHHLVPTVLVPTAAGAIAADHVMDSSRIPGGQKGTPSSFQLHGCSLLWTLYKKYSYVRP